MVGRFISLIRGFGGKQIDFKQQLQSGVVFFNSAALSITL